jgi:hypothetical protein
MVLPAYVKRARETASQISRSSVARFSCLNGRALCCDTLAFPVPLKFSCGTNVCFPAKEIAVILFFALGPLQSSDPGQTRQENSNVFHAPIRLGPCASGLTNSAIRSGSTTLNCSTSVTAATKDLAEMQG